MKNKQNKETKEKSTEYYKRPHSLTRINLKGAYGFIDQALLEIGADPSYVMSSLFKAVAEHDLKVLHRILAQCYFAGANAHRMTPDMFIFEQKSNFEYESQYRPDEDISFSEPNTIAM